MPSIGESFRYDVQDSMKTLNGYIDRIKAYALDGIGDPFVLDAARKITSKCSPYDQACETKAVFEFVRSRVKYTPAPARYGKEVLQTSAKMLDDIVRFGRASGECEEIAILLSSLLANLNIEVALVYGADDFVVEDGARQPNYKHVWVAVKIPAVSAEWIHLDATGYRLEPGQHFKFLADYRWDPLS